MSFKLYPDQEEFLQEIRSGYRKYNRFVAMLPTGGGKSAVAASIIQGMAARGLRVLFLVPRISLIQQTVRAFNRYGIDDICIVHGKNNADPRALVTIGSIDTVIRRERVSYDLVIHDEAHHMRDQMLKWMLEFPNERHIGLTATPTSNRMGDYYEGLVKGKSMAWLIENKRLCPYEIYVPSAPDTSKLKLKNTQYGLDYSESDLEELMGDAKVCGDVVSNWLANGEDRLTMVLCVNVAHAGAVTQAFLDAGVTTEIIHAKVKTEDREAIFHRMKLGITKVVVSVSCLTEGFDEPLVSCLINCRPTKSIARWIQGAGRVLRYMEGKQAVIFDHSYTSLELGFPCQIEINELNKGGSKSESERQQKEKEELPEAKPKICDNCGFLKEPKVVVCPKCGAAPMKKEDVEVDLDREMVKVKGKEKEVSRAEQQEFYSMLLHTAQRKGYKMGWVNYKFKDKYKEFPKGFKDEAVHPDLKFTNYMKHLAIKQAKGRARYKK